METNESTFLAAWREPGEPVLRHDDDAERHRGRDLDQLRLDRPQPLHRHRVRGGQPRHRRGRAPRPRRHRRRRRRPAAPRRRVTPLTVSAFARMGALSTRNDDPARASRPFDADRDGFVMAEGAAFVILETLERAVARGARIYGEVARLRPQRRRVPHHRTVARRCRRGRVHAARARRRRPRSRPTIGHVNAHGTSTPLNDASEAEAIRKVFGDARAAGHVHQGRHRAHDRRRRGRRSARSRCCRCATAIVPPTANLEQIGDDIGLDVVCGEPRGHRAGAGAVELVRLRRPQRHADRSVTPCRIRPCRPSVIEPCPSRDAASSGTAATPSTPRPGARRPVGRAGSASTAASTAARSARAEGETIERAVHLAVELGIPIVGRIATLGRRRQRRRGRRCTHGGASPRRWPTRRAWCRSCCCSSGPAVSGPALLLGIADHVIMTADAFAYVTGPDVVVAVHRRADRPRPARRRRRCTSATAASPRWWSTTRTTRWSPPASLLSYLPDNHLADPPFEAHRRPRRPRLRARRSRGARRVRPRPYDVRHVIDDVLDDAHRSSSCAPAYAPSMVTGARAPRRAHRRRGRQPADVQAGSLDIDAAQKAARFVQWCDCFNVAGHHLRRHQRVPPGPRPRVARDHPPRRAAAARVRGGHRAAARASCCARPTAARTS